MCVWSLKAPVGRVFRLDLDTINLKNFPKICSRLDINYLSVYEPIEFECKNYTSRTLVSSGRRMQVMYTQPTNKEQRPVGVVAKYAQIPFGKKTKIFCDIINTFVNVPFSEQCTFSSFHPCPTLISFSRAQLSFCFIFWCATLVSLSFPVRNSRFIVFR